jgi:hypothetical protein
MLEPFHIFHNKKNCKPFQFSPLLEEFYKFARLFYNIKELYDIFFFKSLLELAQSKLQL